jgi:hypothetical protein
MDFSDLARLLESAMEAMSKDTVEALPPVREFQKVAQSCADTTAIPSARFFPFKNVLNG